LIDALLKTLDITLESRNLGVALCYLRTPLRSHILKFHTLITSLIPSNGGTDPRGSNYTHNAN
jgi:hypothetical protein